MSIKETFEKEILDFRKFVLSLKDEYSLKKEKSEKNLYYSMFGLFISSNMLKVICLFLNIYIFTVFVLSLFSFTNVIENLGNSNFILENNIFFSILAALLGIVANLALFFVIVILIKKIYKIYYEIRNGKEKIRYNQDSELIIIPLILEVLTIVTSSLISLNLFYVLSAIFALKLFFMCLVVNFAKEIEGQEIKKCTINKIKNGEKYKKHIIKDKINIVSFLSELETNDYKKTIYSKAINREDDININFCDIKKHISVFELKNVVLLILENNEVLITVFYYKDVNFNSEFFINKINEEYERATTTFIGMEKILNQEFVKEIEREYELLIKMEEQNLKKESGDLKSNRKKI